MTIVSYLWDYPTRVIGSSNIYTNYHVDHVDAATNDGNTNPKQDTHANDYDVNAHMFVTQMSMYENGYMSSDATYNIDSNPGLSGSVAVWHQRENDVDVIALSSNMRESISIVDAQMITCLTLNDPDRLHVFPDADVFNKTLPHIQLTDLASSEIHTH